ncbi:MAG: MBL fold metallo-hydrolase [Acidobacteriota bacterium]
MTEPLRWMIGDIKVTAVVESVTTGISRFVLPQATPEAVGDAPWLAPYLDENRQLLMTIQSFLVESGEQKLLVDTCVGNDKERRFREWNRLDTDYLQRLEQAGAAADAVDAVLCTHLHVDHVGWNTRLQVGRWVPTFVNARYLFGRAEWEYWKDRPEEVDTVIGDSVRPIIEGGLADLVEHDAVIGEGLRLVPTPGHTPGHVSLEIESRGESGFITGDMVHHPCQLQHADWAASPDVDPEVGTATRRTVFERYADTPTLFIGSHFHAPTAGRIVRDGDVYRLDV